VHFVFFKLVGSLPTTYQSSFGGATAVTSATLDGAYVQHEEHLYELQCKFNFGYLYQISIPISLSKPSFIQFFR
jgi:hypothetical protein